MQPDQIIAYIDETIKDAELAIDMIDNDAKKAYIDGLEERAAMLVEYCSCIKVGVIYRLEKLKEFLLINSVDG